MHTVVQVYEPWKQKEIKQYGNEKDDFQYNNSSGPKREIQGISIINTVVF